MKNALKVINNEGQEIIIELFFSFKIEELNKEYVVYSINDDELSDSVNVLISEIYYENNSPKIRSIEEKEKEMVLLFYNDVKNSIVNQ